MVRYLSYYCPDFNPKEGSYHQTKDFIRGNDVAFRCCLQRHVFIWHVFMHILRGNCEGTCISETLVLSNWLDWCEVHMNSYLYCGCRWKWRVITAVNFGKKLENLLRWSLSTFIYNRSTNMNYFIWNSHHFTAREDMNSINWPHSQCVAS